MKAAVVEMFSKETTLHEFDVLIYNRTAAELMTVPNEVIATLARRYPAHYATPFDVYDIPARPYARD